MNKNTNVYIVRNSQSCSNRYRVASYSGSSLDESMRGIVRLKYGKPDRGP